MIELFVCPTCGVQIRGEDGAQHLQSHDLVRRLSAQAEALRDELRDRPCVHEWRLATHGPASFEFFQQEGAPGYGRVETSGRKTKWYCVHCRIFEETIDVDESPLE